MQKKQNEGWDDISKEDSSRKPITAWAVEIEGKIDPADVYPTCATARYVRNAEAATGLYKKISVRKVNLIPVPGR
jgi:hypothetical protein